MLNNTGSQVSFQQEKVKEMNNNLTYAPSVAPSSSAEEPPSYHVSTHPTAADRALVLPSVEDHRASFPLALQDQLRFYQPVTTDIVRHRNSSFDVIRRGSLHILITNLIDSQDPSCYCAARVYYESPCQYCKIAERWPSIRCFDIFSAIDSKVLADVVGLIKWKTREVYTRENWDANMMRDDDWKLAAVYSRENNPPSWSRRIANMLCGCCGPDIDEPIYIEDLDLSGFITHGNFPVSDNSLES